MNYREQQRAMERLETRRRFVRLAGIGTAFAALGGWYLFADDEQTKAAKREQLSDGRPRLPPGQRVINYLKPMGGVAGNPSKSRFRLKVHGEVDNPFEVDFQGLMTMPQRELELDVHCVTGWSRLGARWEGVRLADIAAVARPKPTARYVILEAAHGYTANVGIEHVLDPKALVAHRFEGEPLAGRNGAPVRAVIPSLYFWKSAKWLTGVRFSDRNTSGYWEVRGYHDRGDPWLEERYG
ncbi:Sulfite oxidase and related enzyme [Plesiocystis pacifica SIR-1]|uniref:Sulfite oxidase and related enzyme n=1 Tax=Plesiocystis pacifica SIR-1 TaxID=391625 RepID=A6GK34_9BACT|nr:molybdopterin-dependent oxidoreductase [Plesiocystis pacifica]EDM73762.1 Sulfite oxidase and related enzyme [Plesiocystis pacifica SIR-1]